MNNFARLALSAAMLVGVSVAASLAAASRLMMHARRLIVTSNMAPGEELIGQVVLSIADPKWRGLVLGTASDRMLLVEWSRPDRFIGLAKMDDVAVVNDPTVKDRYVCHRR